MNEWKVIALEKLNTALIYTKECRKAFFLLEGTGLSNAARILESRRVLKRAIHSENTAIEVYRNAITSPEFQ